MQREKQKSSNVRFGRAYLRVARLEVATKSHEENLVMVATERTMGGRLSLKVDASSPDAH